MSYKDNKIKVVDLERLQATNRRYNIIVLYLQCFVLNIYNSKYFLFYKENFIVYTSSSIFIIKKYLYEL